MTILSCSNPSEPRETWQKCAHGVSQASPGHQTSGLACRVAAQIQTRQISLPVRRHWCTVQLAVVTYTCSIRPAVLLDVALATRRDSAASALPGRVAPLCVCLVRWLNKTPTCDFLVTSHSHPRDQHPAIAHSSRDCANKYVPARPGRPSIHVPLSQPSSTPKPTGPLRQPHSGSPQRDSTHLRRRTSHQYP